MSGFVKLILKSFLLRDLVDRLLCRSPASLIGDCVDRVNFDGAVYLFHQKSSREPISLN